MTGSAVDVLVVAIPVSKPCQSLKLVDHFLKLWSYVRIRTCQWRRTGQCPMNTESRTSCKPMNGGSAQTEVNSNKSSDSTTVDCVMSLDSATNLAESHLFIAFPSVGTMLWRTEGCGDTLALFRRVHEPDLQGPDEFIHLLRPSGTKVPLAESKHNQFLWSLPHERVRNKITSPA